MGGQVGTGFATGSFADVQIGWRPPRRYASRPRRQYRPRGMPLDQMPNLHLFALPEQSPNRRFRQVAAPSRRPGAVWAAVCIAALATGTFVYTSEPHALDETAVVQGVLTAGSFRTPTIPVPTQIDTLQSDRLPRSVTPSRPPAPSLDRAVLPRLEIATPSVRAFLGPEVLPRQPAPATISFDLPAAANVPVVPNTPVMPAVAPSDRVFTCLDCGATAPVFDQVQIAIFAPTSTAELISAQLRQLGALDPSVDPAPIGVRQNQVRYYNVADATAARTLAQQFAANVVDLTWYSAAVPAGRLELWLAAPDGPT